MDQTLFFSLLTFCLGLLLGHWLSVGRDRRKEYNEVADRIRDGLLKEQKHNIPGHAVPTLLEWEQLEDGLAVWRRPGFRRARAERDALTANFKRDAVGGVYYPEPRRFNEAAAALLRYVKRK